MELKDSKFDELDWLSQATEPYICRLYDIHNAIPDKMSIPYHELHKCMVSSFCSWGATRNGLIKSILADKPLLLEYYKTLCYGTQEAISDTLTIDIVGKPILDIDSQSIINGEVFLTKKSSALEDKVIVAHFIRTVSSFRFDNINDDIFSKSAMLNQKSRCKEILEAIGVNAKIKNTFSSISNFLKRSIESKIEKDEWKIRDEELLLKLMGWLKDYIQDGNLAAVHNFYRFKLMTNDNRAIYSIEEVE